MSIASLKNVLCVGAHPDDIELMAGGTVSRLVKAGSQVRFLTFTNGVWKSPEGKWQRDAAEAVAEGQAAAESLGVVVENLGLPAMDLQFEDRLVVEVLQRLEKYDIDTLICPWDQDLHHDHEIASRIAVSASRRIPRVLMGSINFYLRSVFTPNLFIDITDSWDEKIAAMERYQTQWQSSKTEWLPWLDESSRTYGRMLGVPRAEGFITQKFLID